ncbi:hypothetical protein R7Z42_00590 [Vibrio sp. 1863]|uniref:hypothetical protein n=1 Tax=Vibrio sp. 1863 TaxID=3074579 RepID=UPI002964721F|nr:hypothetical protein [Vibrio sp. 1863]MDW2073510.1 hypothetical protein [Vibrio sp. 1863]
MATQVNHIKSRCGSGKSLGLIRDLHKLLETRFTEHLVLFASKTNDLTTQNHGLFTRLNEDKGIEVPCLRVDSTTNKGLVCETINMLLENGSEGVIFISHATLKLLDTELMDQVDLFIDEVPQELCGVFDVKYNADSGLAFWEQQFLVTEPSNYTGYQKVRIADQYLPTMPNEGTLVQFIEGIYTGNNNRDSVHVAELLTHLQAGYEATYTTTTDSEGKTSKLYQSTYWLHMKNLLGTARTVTILAAELERSMFGFLAKNFLQMPIEPMSLFGMELEQKHLNQITIHPILKSGEWSTNLRNSEAHTSLTYQGKALNFTGSVEDVAQRITKHIMQDREFVLTLHSKSKVSDELKDQASVTTSAVHGMNHLRHLDNAAFLATARPSPFEVKALRMFAKDRGLNADALVDAVITERCYEAMYQCVARTSIRMPYAKVQGREHIFVVPDMKYAEYLSEWFVDGCVNIDTSLSLDTLSATKREDAYYERRRIAVAILTDKKNKVGKVKDLLMKYGISRPTFSNYVKEHKQHLVEVGLK